MPRTPIRLVAAMSCAFAALAHAQSFNIDLDQPSAPPALGGGAPSNAFGAASGQAGFWNAVPSAATFALTDINGVLTAATITLTGSSSSLAFNNGTNSGDYRLLMNDARQVGTVVQGGTTTVTFNNLINGNYQLYTYAAPPQGTPGSTDVIVNGNSMFAIGGASGNTFTLGGTHVIHNVTVTGNTLTMIVVDPPGDGLPGYLNGFQLIIPAPGAAASLAMLGALGLRRRRSETRP